VFVSEFAVAEADDRNEVVREMGESFVSGGMVGMKSRE